MAEQGATVRPSAGRDRLMAAAAAMLRVVSRRLPADTQAALHRHIIDRHFAWRSIPLDFTTGDGLHIRGDMRDVILRRLYFDDVWEPDLARLLRSRLRPGDVFLDVGSNFGYFSLLASRLVGPAGAVWAFDASPTIYNRLVNALADNGAANVVARNLALSDRMRRLPVFLAGSANPGSTTTVTDQGELALRGAVLETEIEALPLCQAAPMEILARTALIKIDVEGAEADVLAGLLPALDGMREDLAIVLELNPAMLERAGHAPEAVLAPFLERGFHSFFLPDRSGRLAPLRDLRAASDDFGIANLVLSRAAAVAGVAA